KSVSGFSTNVVITIKGTQLIASLEESYANFLNDERQIAIVSLSRHHGDSKFLRAIKIGIKGLLLDFKELDENNSDKRKPKIRPQIGKKNKNQKYLWMTAMWTKRPIYRIRITILFLYWTFLK